MRHPKYEMQTEGNAGYMNWQHIKQISFNVSEPGEAVANIGLVPVLYRLKVNSQGFWLKYRVAISLFTLALLADGLSTVYFMTYLGTSAEMHPVVRFASITFGPIAGPIIGSLWKWVTCLYLAIYCRRLAFPLFLIPAIVYVLAAWYNISCIYWFV